MSTELVRQTMFTLGEVDPILWKRAEMEVYMTGAQRLLNVEVKTTGLAAKRRGTRFLLDVTAYAEISSQIYSFQDKNRNFYLILSKNNAFEIFYITPVTNALTHIQTLVSTYTTAQLPSIDYTQDNDVLVLVHPSHAPARIYISTYNVNPLLSTFALANLSISPAPAYDFNTINYNSFAVAFTSTATNFTMDVTGGNPGFTTDWIGGQIVGFGNTAQNPIGYGIITGVNLATPGHTIFTGVVSIRFAADADMPVIGSQYSIRQPSFSATLGYPSCVLFYQNRLWFGNTLRLPGTVFGSRINQPISFDVGVGGDADAIIYTIGQSDSGGITWLNGGKQLEIYSENYEFVAPQDQDVGLTPSTFSIRQQSAYGSSDDLKPITYINDSYYSAKTGKALINYKFTGIGQAYVSSNIAVQSQHLIRNPINRALIRGTSQTQDNFIYFLNSDYSISAFQFSQEYKLAALTPITFSGLIPNEEDINNPLPSDVPCYDLATINNQVYFLKKYSVSNKFVIEVFYDIDDTSYFKIDSYSNATMAVYNDTLGVITGLDLYEGYVMQIVYQNQDYGLTLDEDGDIAAVTGGVAYVFNPEGNIGTTQVGMLYDVIITPMYVYAGPQQSNFFKNLTKMYVDYYQSLNFKINNYQVPYQVFSYIQLGLPLVPQTATVTFSTLNGWNMFDTISITQSSPFDLQITGIAYQIDAKLI